MNYLRRRNLGFSIDEFHALPWWQAWNYDEMMTQDMNGTLGEYRNEPDPPDDEPFEFATLDEIGEYIPPAQRIPDTPTEVTFVPEGDEWAPKYDFPMEDERDHIAPVTYLPVERLGMNIRKDKPPSKG